MWRCLSEKWNWRDRGFMAKSGHDILSILSSSKAGNGQEGRKKEKERGRRRKEAVVRLSLPRMKLRYLIVVVASTSVLVATRVLMVGVKILIGPDKPLLQAASEPYLLFLT